VGSHGAVWLGQWRRSTVAVKKCSSASVSDVQAFEKECLIMSRLNHFNVVRFYGVSRDVGSRFSVDGSLYLVTEYMPKGSLWEVLRSKDSVLSAGTRYQMALDIARGMSYLHSLQPPILHRDLKALNLLVDNSHNVKVADFGIARPRVDDTMTFCGTPKWTAPEVLRMNSYSEKADVFSFGVVCVAAARASQVCFHV
jgi:serine/threonine protein kinase